MPSRGKCFLPTTTSTSVKSKNCLVIVCPFLNCTKKFNGTVMPRNCCSCHSTYKKKVINTGRDKKHLCFWDNFLFLWLGFEECLFVISSFMYIVVHIALPIREKVSKWLSQTEFQLSSIQSFAFMAKKHHYVQGSGKQIVCQPCFGTGIVQRPPLLSDA